MAVTVLKQREAQPHAPRPAPSASPAVDDFLHRATLAREVFATRSDFHEWFGCVLQHRASGEPKRGRAECDAISALACALSFRGECVFATAGRQLDAVMRDLPTGTLENLLRLCSERPIG
jgi:hypothetical protein